jgi:hypothetical protein
MSQTEFSNIVKGLYKRTRRDLSLECKCGHLRKSITLICHISRLKQRKPRMHHILYRKKIYKNPTLYLLKKPQKIRRELPQCDKGHL